MTPLRACTYACECCGSVTAGTAPVCARRVRAGRRRRNNCPSGIRLNYPFDEMSSVLALSLFAFFAPATRAGITGRVVDAITHQPIRLASVKVFNNTQEWNEITGADGRFRFSTLVKAEYRLVAHRPLFSERAYIIETSDFDTDDELKIELFPQAVIAGVVLDRFGHGMPASVQFYGQRTGNGKIEVLGGARTNDLGEYRIFGLEPGSYQVRATATIGRSSDFDPRPVMKAGAYYGGDAKPATITATPGSITSGIDFTLIPTRPATVRGTVVTERGDPVSSAGFCTGEAPGEWSCGGGRLEKDGTFTMYDLGNGPHTITAETRDERNPLFGSASFDVHGEDIEGTRIVLYPPVKIEGQVRVEGDRTAGLETISFQSNDNNGSRHSQAASPSTSGTFTVMLHAGEYRIVVPVPKGFRARATFDGKELADSSLQVLPSSQPKQLVIVLTRVTQ